MKQRCNIIVIPYIADTSEKLRRIIFFTNNMPAQTHGPKWGARSSGLNSAVYLRLKHEGHSFEDSNVHILAREERWFKRGVKKSHLF